MITIRKGTIIILLLLIILITGCKSLMGNGRKDELNGNYPMAVINYTAAKMQEDITKIELHNELNRMKEILGKEAFSLILKEVDTICHDEAEAAENQGYENDRFFWQMVYLNVWEWKQGSLLQ